MISSSIYAQALEHLPALAVMSVLIYATYWMIGIFGWPRVAWRERFTERSSVAVEALGGFSVKSLALVSLTSLFLELLLVRWIASEIRVFAYFKSLPLIACFLGFGLGCYLTRKKICLLYTLAPLLGMVLLVETPWRPLRRLVVNLSAFIGWFSDVHIWSRAYFNHNAAWGFMSAAIAVVTVIAIFGLIAVAFIPLGQLVGWYLEKSPKGIQGYSINVLASIAGIWLYTLLCFLSTRPVVWFACLALGLVVCFWNLPRLRTVVLAWTAALLVLFAAGGYRTHWWGEESWKGSSAAIYELKPGQPQIYWSPYQKLTLVPLIKDGETVKYVLNTNDSWYQEIMNLSSAGVAAHPELYAGVEIPFHQYNLPYQFYKNPPSVLIAGAGMGNDVASALRNGAGHVTAVEIDPLIYHNGKRMHFEHPYDSDKVEVHVDDARAFIQNTRQKYDLVVYSILDSHTTSSYYTNIRLDNYVYTLESMRATRELLKPDGLFVMSFSSERPWFAGRLRDLIIEAFGKAPLLIHNGPEFFIMDPGNRVARRLAEDPALKQFVDTHSNVKVAHATPSTDDWPYLYQQSRGIPVVVWVLSLGLTVVCWLTFRRLKQTGEGLQWHFFFLGAAFMLMEVQIISKAALLFGTTWLVNSIVITSLLLFILLSNLVAAKFPDFPRWAAYGGLMAALLVSYLVPSEGLFFDSMLMRGVAATMLFCSPVFFAGLIFISSFREIGFRAEAFGSNLMGSLVGGLLESLSYLTGIKALVIVAAVLYALAFATRARAKSPEPAARYAVSA